ncbi:hypothetical protein GJAV_G00044630 [Gymnothorax javanicus]|nr:hypothetical protein GJAV_G00044630 [Gymnothorax javanicus]
MFLKNVPPVVALHTEWRSYGPKRNFSLPLCFNDSDSDISTSGTPIPEKVQMIIDSLRNTESSIDMSDEYEGILQTGQAPPPGCSSKTVDVGHRAGCRGTLGGAREDDKHVDSLELRTQSHDDSDSDDSVDRGIEEAIQEYLKKKVLAERRALTGDKSSSFDSDEDLDAAIKDLLLTKKKVKRKIRDRKLKSRKCANFTAVDLHPVEELDSEKRKTPLDCKPLSSTKNTKSCISKSSKVTPKQSTDDKSIGPKLSKNASGKLKDGKIVKHSCQLEQMNEKKGHANVDSSSRDNHLGAAQAEDSSSVDSDDSIEQEIRKFLAEKAKSSMVRTNDAVEMKQEAQQAEIPQTAETLDRCLPGSNVSAQVGCWEGEVLKSPIGLEARVPHSPDEGPSLSEAVISDSSSILQPDKEVNIAKEMKSLKNSHTEQNGPGMEKVLSDPEISTVLRSDNTDNCCADLVPLSVTQLGAAVSKSPFHINPPTRDRERRMMNKSDLHVPAHDTSDTMHLAEGTHENVNHNELMVPSSQSIAAIPRFAIPTPARQTNTNLRFGEAGGVNLGHASTPSPAGNVMHGQMDLPMSSERSSHGYNYVEIKSRDRSESVDEKYYSREREEGKRKGGDFLREEYEECIDETDDESEESPSASQSSKGKKQFPRLVLSTTIDPGESFRPYIILNSPERNLRFSRRSVILKDQLVWLTCI